MLMIITLMISNVFNLLQIRDGWRGIVPLKSTRTDVERLLDERFKTKQSSPDESIYELENEKVSIYYSKGPCENSFWKSPADTVLFVTVSFRKKVKLADLKINQRLYKRKPDLKDSDSYIDEDNGINIYVNSNRTYAVERYLIKIKHESAKSN